MISFRLATKARACGFHVDRKANTIDRLPMAGAVASLEVQTGDRKHTAGRVAAGVVGGVVFLPLALVGFSKRDSSKVFVTFTTADGRITARIVPVKRHQVALELVNMFNNGEVTK